MTQGNYTIEVSEKTGKAIAEIAEGFNLSISELLEDIVSKKLLVVSSKYVDENIINIKKELHRLHWLNGELEDYLTKEYGTNLIRLLTDRELCECLKDLQRLNSQYYIEEREENFDFIEVVVQTGQELYRLEWTSEKMRKFLIERYGEPRTRQHLTDREIIDFLWCLQAEPDSDPYNNNEFDSEQIEQSIDFVKVLQHINHYIHLLKWTKKQEQEFLSNVYQTNSRETLSDTQILNFLSYLRDQTKPLLDFDKILAQTNVEIERLGWTQYQERIFVMERYGKRSRQVLTDLELIDLLEYLRSEPIPLKEDNMNVNESIYFSEVLAQTNIEIRRIGWTQEQGRNCLQERYGKRSRQILTDEELLDFLEYLRSQPTEQNQNVNSGNIETSLEYQDTDELDIDDIPF